MTYLSDTLYVSKLLQGGKTVKTAQEGKGIMESAVQGITDYVKSKWDPEHPAASVIAFLAPGILRTLTGTWIVPILYELAAACGFNWEGFFSSIGKTIGQFAEEIYNSVNKPHPNDVAQKVEQTVNQNFDDHFTGSIDPSKLMDLGKKVFMGEPTDKVVNQSLYTDDIIKQGAGKISFLKALLGGHLKKLLIWLITTAFISLGLASAAGAARGVLGLPGDPKSNKAGPDDEGSSTERQPINSQQLNPAASKGLFEIHPNDVNNIWLERGNINNIKQFIYEWIQEAFPQLASEKDQIINSTSFIEMENLFRDRNKMAQGLNVYTVPRPFQKKIDVVSYIINKYLKTRK